MKSKFYRTIALIGHKKTNGRANKQCLEAFNINNLINFLFCISMLIVFVYEGYENYLVNITIITIIYSPIMLFFSTLGYRKLLVVFYIVWQILFTSEIHISLYSKIGVSLPALLLVFSIPIQAYNVFSTKKRVYRYYVLLIVLLLVASFVLYKFHAEHLAKVHLEKDILLLEWFILIFAVLFITINLNIIMNHFTQLNKKIYDINKDWENRIKGNENNTKTCNQQILTYRKKEIERMDESRLDSIKNKIYDSLESTLINKTNIDFFLISNFIMTIFNAKHIAIYVKKDGYLKPLSIFINGIKKNVDNEEDLTREYLSLQNILRYNKLQILENVENHVKQSGVSEDLLIDKMLYMEINQSYNDYILVCHTPNIDSLDSYYLYYHETIKDIFACIERISNLKKNERNKGDFSLGNKKTEIQTM